MVGYDCAMKRWLTFVMLALSPTALWANACVGDTTLPPISGGGESDGPSPDNVTATNDAGGGPNDAGGGPNDAAEAEAAVDATVDAPDAAPPPDPPVIFGSTNLVLWLAADDPS